MWQKNNGKDETEILQNRFTAYLATAVHHCRNNYIEQTAKMRQMEFMTDLIENNQGYEMEEDIFLGLPLSMQLESKALICALKELDARERYVLFSRVLDERSFESLANEMGLGYKGVAAVYYRTLRKVRKKIKEMTK